MFILTSPCLALKGKLKLSITTTDLLVFVFILALYVTNCQARDLRVHGKHCSSKLLNSLLPHKDVLDGGGAAKGSMTSSSEVPVGSKIDASMVSEVVIVAKKEVSSSGDPCRGSLRKTFEGIKVRSRIGERSVLGANGSSSKQVGSNATTVFAAETLVAMDYLDAQPAPSVHNR